MAVPITSGINTAIPADNLKVSKADMRSNFLAAKTEIEYLMRATRPMWQMAFGNTPISS
jgi:hypothetical protein